MVAFAFSILSIGVYCMVQTTRFFRFYAGSRYRISAPTSSSLSSIFSVADPGSGKFFWPLDPGWVKSQNPDPDPGWTTRIIFPRAYKPFFWVKILKFFDADPGSGMEKIRIWDGKSQIRDPGSATLSILFFMNQKIVYFFGGVILV
jgi:hypothetical protein